MSRKEYPLLKGHEIKGNKIIFKDGRARINKYRLRHI